MSKQFFRFGLRQLLLLFAALSLLLGVLTPQIQRAYVSRQLERRDRRLADALTNLHNAVDNNDLELARKALTVGADPNLVIEKPLLLRCIERGQIAMMELLLDFGADMDHVEQYDGPPLHAAIGSRQPAEVRLEMIRLLVEHGAEPHASAMDVAVRHSDPEAADLLKELGAPYGAREMAAFNRLEELRRVVENDPEVLVRRFRPVFAARPGQGPTLLGLALERGHREMAEFLIESGAPLDTVEGRGQTPLHLAARGGDPELIRLLATHGLDVNAKDEYQDTPLTHTVWRAPPEAIVALIEAGADINARGEYGTTALLRVVWPACRLPEEGAAFSERLEVIRILLEADADPSIPDRDGKTAFEWARDKSPKIAKLLAEFMAPHGE